jgi:hypothetical protein
MTPQLVDARTLSQAKPVPEGILARHTTTPPCNPCTAPSPTKGGAECGRWLGTIETPAGWRCVNHRGPKAGRLRNPRDVVRALERLEPQSAVCLRGSTRTVTRLAGASDLRRPRESVRRQHQSPGRLAVHCTGLHVRPTQML